MVMFLTADECEQNLFSSDYGKRRNCLKKFARNQMRIGLQRIHFRCGVFSSFANGCGIV